MNNPVKEAQNTIISLEILRVIKYILLMIWISWAVLPWGLLVIERITSIWLKP